MKVLCDSSLYESGKLLEELVLAEGAKSEEFILIENFSGAECNLQEVPKDSLQESERRALTEATGKGVLMVLEGRFQMEDTENQNGRIYPASIWERICSPGSKQMKWASDGEMLGECDHPKDGETLLQRVVCMTTKFWHSENNHREIIGRMVVFDTTQGRDLKAIHDGGGRLGVSSRGQGSLVRKDGIDVVQDDFELECWDIVYNPSTPGAYPEKVTEDMSKKVVESTSEEIKAELVKDDPACGAAIAKDEADHDSLELPKDTDGQIQQPTACPDCNCPEGQCSCAKGSHPPGCNEKKREEPELRARDDAVQAAVGAETDPPPKTGRNYAPRIEPKEEPYDRLKGRSMQEGDVDERAPNVRQSTPHPGQKGSIDVSPPPTTIPGPGDKPPKKDDERPETECSERAESVEEALEILRGTGAGAGMSDAQSTVKEARSAYRYAVRMDGPLHKHEAEAIKLYVAEVVEATLLSETSVEEIQELAREAAIKECTEKFQPLIEAQTTKALDAVRGVAKVKKVITENADKLEIAKRVIEELRNLVLNHKDKLSEAKSTADAATTLAEALVEEIRCENLRSAVKAIASTHNPVEGLSESISKATSVDDAIGIARHVFESKTTQFTREPVTEREARITRALTANREVRKSQEVQQTRKAKFGKPTSPLEETLSNVEKTLEEYGLR